MRNNTGVTVDFNGAVNLGQTTAITENGVTMTENDAATTVNFNAALQITTNGDDGIFATESGTLTTVAGSTINTTDAAARRRHKHQR